MRILTATFRRPGLGTYEQGLPNLRGLISHFSGVEDPKGPLNPRRPYRELGVQEGSRVYSTSRQRVPGRSVRGGKRLDGEEVIQNIPGNAIKASPDLE